MVLPIYIESLSSLLQEVIDRSQEKLKSLKDYDQYKECATQYDLVHMNDAETTTEDNSSEIVASEVKDSEQNETDNSSNNEKIETESSLERESQGLETPSKEICNKTSQETDQASKETGLSQADASQSDDSADGPTSDVTKEEYKSEANEKSDDSGVDTEESPVEEKQLSKSKSEKNIKNKILSILQDAKAQENTKNVRSNYGRNFEFQQTRLKPVIPNDRRPAKASFKLLDNNHI